MEILIHLPLLNDNIRIFFYIYLKVSLKAIFPNNFIKKLFTQAIKGGVKFYKRINYELNYL